MPAEIARPRRLRAAARIRQPAALGEDAADDPPPRRGQEPRDRLELSVRLAPPGLRQAAQQAMGVRVAGIGEQRIRRPLLDQHAGIEHADALAHPPDDAEIVADQQQRGRELAPQRRDQVEHLGLHRRVEPGRRLVEHEERGLLGQRHADQDTLLLAARELVRIARHHAPGRRDPHPPEHRRRPRLRRRARNPQHLPRLRHLPPDRERRVERARRILEHHRNMRRAEPPERPRVEPGDILARDADAPGGDPPRPRQNAERGQRQRRFPAARFAHQPIGPTGGKRKTHPAQHALIAPARPIGNLQPLHRKRRAHAAIAPCSPSASRLTPTTSEAVAAASNATVHQ